MFGFITKDISKGIVYNGDIKNIDYCYSRDEALIWYEKIKVTKSISFIEDSINIYGKIYKYTLPKITLDPGEQNIFIENKEKEITEAMYDFLVNLSTWKMIDDIVFGVWQKILYTHKAVFIDDIICFYKFKEEDKGNIAYDTIDEQAVVVMMKEYVDGFIADYDYIVDLGKDKSKQTIKIGQNYKIKIPGTDEEDIIRGNYTVALRNIAFSEAAEERRVKELLDETPPLLYSWQYDLKKRMGHRTIFTNIRRAGKSQLLANIFMEELLREYKHLKTRPANIIYVGENHDNIQPIVRYIKNIIGNFGEHSSMFFLRRERDLTLRFMEGKREIAVGRFVTDSQESPAVGDNCECLIIDEVARISQKTWDLIEPFMSNQNAKLIAATTMYKGIKKSWVYKYLAEYEMNASKERNIDSLIIKRYRELRNIEKRYEAKEITEKEYHTYVRAFRDKMDQRYIGLRYTIDDNNKYSEKEKEKIKKEKLDKDPEGYFCELYSRFSDEGKVFKYNKLLDHSENILTKKYKYLVVAYDPARTEDISAIIVLGYNQYIKRVYLLEEHQLNSVQSTSFDIQANMIKDIMKNVKQKYSEYQDKEPLFVMDSTHPGVADVMILKGLYPSLRIFNKGGSAGASQGKAHNEIMCSKSFIIDTVKHLFKDNKIIINRELKMLIKQLENFYEIGINQYGGVGDHDDFVCAMSYGIFYLYETMGLKYQIMKEEDTSDKTSGPDYTGAINEKIKRDEFLRASSKQYEANSNYFRNYVY